MPAASYQASPNVAPAPQISYRAVSQQFGAGNDVFTATTDIDLDVLPGEFLCIIGPSGCGKSTLLNLAAGLLKPSSGVVQYAGHALKSVNTAVGYVTQADSLLPWRTAAKNVALALEVQGVRRSERRDRTKAMLEAVGLAEFGDRYPHQLSGGMRKRVSLAQTLIYEPETLLMDEPFGALDAQLRMSLQKDLLRLCDETARTVMFVTHDLEEAIILADRIVVFSASPGTITHVEAVDLPRPRDVLELRADPQFAAIWDRVWKHMALPDAKA